MNKKEKLAKILGVEERRLCESGESTIIGDSFVSKALVDTIRLEEEDIRDCIVEIRGRGAGKYYYRWLREDCWSRRIKDKVRKLWCKDADPENRWVVVHFSEKYVTVNLYKVNEETWAVEETNIYKQFSGEFESEVWIETLFWLVDHRESFEE